MVGGVKSAVGAHFLDILQEILDAPVPIFPIVEAVAILEMDRKAVVRQGVPQAAVHAVIGHVFQSAVNERLRAHIVRTKLLRQEVGVVRSVRIFSHAAQIRS